MRAKTGWLMVIRTAFFFFVDVQCLCEVLFFFFFAFLLRCPQLYCSCKYCFYLFTLSPVPTRFFFFFEALVLAM